MSVKDAAILDIKEELKKQGKCFIAYQKKLNPVMNNLVSEHLKQQSLCQSSK